jgi:hypothetical protein
MSNINPSGINVNFPVQGSNNPSQVFRSNSANIVANFNTAGTEITNLQNTTIRLVGPVTSNVATIGSTNSIVLETNITIGMPVTIAGTTGTFTSLVIETGGPAGATLLNGVLTINVGN